MTTVTPEWQAKIDEAQLETTVDLCGSTYARVRYGDDYPELDLKPACRDCGCRLGELHVPVCCVERCPRCGHQAISCDCVCGEGRPRGRMAH
jgi:hypothetical protein